MNDVLPLLIRRADDLRERVGRWRRNGQRIALVPTMGNLHEGHLSLVRQMRPRAERVIVSIFVNPLQFADGEDLASYPRTLDDDRRLLADVGADAVFQPAVSEMYPDGLPLVTQIGLPALEDVLCGEHRDGHFAGVATVVLKLFGLAQPDMAIFGRKDFQQLTILERLVRDLSLPVAIYAGETVREPDGLAMSSRNRYLSEQQRAVAPQLYATLEQITQRIGRGNADAPELVDTARAQLVEAGFRPDYVNVLDATTLKPPNRDTRRVVVAAAVHLGRARLIDNIVTDWPAR